MSLVIASQLEREFNRGLLGLPSAPIVIDVPEDEPWRVAAEADVLLIRPSPAWRERRGNPPIGWPGRLRWILSASAGIDVYPPWLLDAPLVTCGRGVSSDEIADYVIAAIYAHSKNLDAVTIRSRAEFRQQSLGRVSGSTFGIVGLGAIGTEVARRGLALGAQVIAVRRSAEAASLAGVEMVATLEQLVARADHIVIAVPATARTRHLFNENLFAKVKSGAHLINVARGSVVDQVALVAALDAGRLGFATLDVTDPEPLPDGHPLYTHKAVRLTPHISSNSTVLRHRLFEKIATDIGRFAEGLPPSDIVDPARGY